MKLNSGGAIPSPAQTHASSDTLLVSTGLAEAADAGEGDTAVSPWGEFIFAARERKRDEKKEEKAQTALKMQLH